MKTNEEVLYVQPSPGPHGQTIEGIKSDAYLFIVLMLQDDAVLTYIYVQI